MAEENMDEDVIVSEETFVGEEEKQQVAVSDDDSGDSELESYSKGVQTRINKLTEKRRQAERDQAEALRVSQQLLEENKQLRSKVQALDTGYLSEYGNRLQAQEEHIKRVHREAYDAGDSDKLLETQQAMAAMAVEKNRYNTAKARAEQQNKVQVQQQQQQAPQAQQRPQAQPHPRAVQWKEKNSWFGPDDVMTAGALALHHRLESEGFDSATEDYYTELDKRVRKEFPHKFQSAKKTGGAQVASAAASASRQPHHTGRRSVKLTPSQVSIAKKLGVPLEKYAQYVKD
jgi:hypothetical protein